jgi:hypothetical protein
MLAHFTAHFTNTPRYLLLGKLHNFRKRSVWRYLLAGVLLGAARPEWLGSIWLTTPALALGLVALGLGVVVLSAYLQRHKKIFSAEVTFTAAYITVQPDAAGAPAETHDWQWIRQADETSRYFFLVVQPFPRFGLVLDKRRLTAEQAGTFRAWLAQRPLGPPPSRPSPPQA